MAGNPKQVPNFVAAGSPMALRRAMFQNNARKGFQFIYFDIQKDGDRWIAWYLEEVDPKVDGRLAENIGRTQTIGLKEK